MERKIKKRKKKVKRDTDKEIGKRENQMEKGKKYGKATDQHKEDGRKRKKQRGSKTNLCRQASQEYLFASMYQVVLFRQDHLEHNSFLIFRCCSL